MSDLEIQPLTPDRLPDLAKLFGQGGDPKWCWCSWYRLRSVDFAGATPASNRRVLERAVTTTASEDRAPGLVAYIGEEAVGWVSLGPRDDYERLRHSRVLAPVNDEPVWSIVCFVVGRKSRGQGIATALLSTGPRCSKLIPQIPMAGASRRPRHSRARSRCSSALGSPRWRAERRIGRARPGRSCGVRLRQRRTMVPRPERHRDRGPSTASKPEHVGGNAGARRLGPIEEAAG
jgi:hypothetical protein